MDMAGTQPDGSPTHSSYDPIFGHPDPTSRSGKNHTKLAIRPVVSAGSGVGGLGALSPTSKATISTDTRVADYATKVEFENLQVMLGISNPITGHSTGSGTITTCVKCTAACVQTLGGKHSDWITDICSTSTTVAGVGTSGGGSGSGGGESSKFIVATCGDDKRVQLYNASL